jgi:hypothetical protein
MKSIIILVFLINSSFICDENIKASLLPSVKNEAFKRGEKISYRLHYGIIDAAVATLSVTEERICFGSRHTIHVLCTGSSNGISDWFFKVRDRYESYIDEESLVPWMFIRRIDEGGYVSKQDYVFNPFNNKVRTGNECVFDVPFGIQDMISGFYRARVLDLSGAKEGSIYSINCFVDEKIFLVKIKFISRENIKTDFGVIRCLKFRPIIQTGRIFKHEEDLNIWISDDKNHILVKGQADIMFGSVKVEVSSYSGLLNELTFIK